MRYTLTVCSKTRVETYEYTRANYAHAAVMSICRKSHMSAVRDHVGAVGDSIAVTLTLNNAMQAPITWAHLTQLIDEEGPDPSLTIP
jgi:hypothetical protein